MKVVTVTYKNIEAEFSQKDLNIFHNILREVQVDLEDNGFESRLNLSPRQARGFFTCIAQEIHQYNVNKIKLSWLEIIFLNNLLNEVCNGISLSNFEIKIGISRDEVEKILDLISTVIDEMRSLKKIRRNSYLPSSKKSQDKGEKT